MNETHLSAEFTDTQGDGQHAARLRLWNAILLAQFEDMIGAMGKDRKRLEYHDARNWFGDFIDDDFREVCENAGHDPRAVWERSLRLDASDEATRRAAMKRMNTKRGEA